MVQGAWVLPGRAEVSPLPYGQDHCPSTRAPRRPISSPDTPSHYRHLFTHACSLSTSGDSPTSSGTCTTFEYSHVLQHVGCVFAVDLGTCVTLSAPAPGLAAQALGLVTDSHWLLVYHLLPQMIKLASVESCGPNSNLRGEMWDKFIKHFLPLFKKVVNSHAHFGVCLEAHEHS